MDGRYYYGMHYREIRDLLGGDYALAPGTGRDRNADRRDPACGWATSSATTTTAKPSGWAATASSNTKPRCSRPW